MTIICTHPKEQIVHMRAGKSGYACLACGAYIHRPGDFIPEDLLEALRAIVAAARRASLPPLPPRERVTPATPAAGEGAEG